MSKGSYLILGLPRSRTAWLSKFLPNCFHEYSMHFHSLEGFKNYLENVNCGIADTALIQHLDWIQENINVPIVVIDRNFEDVKTSLQKLSLPTDIKQLPNTANVFRIAFEDIDKRLEELCNFIDVKYDKARHEYYKNINIQADTEYLLQEIIDNQENIMKLYGDTYV